MLWCARSIRRGAEAANAEEVDPTANNDRVRQSWGFDRLFLTIVTQAIIHWMAEQVHRSQIENNERRKCITTHL